MQLAVMEDTDLDLCTSENTNTNPRNNASGPSDLSLPRHGPIVTVLHAKNGFHLNVGKEVKTVACLKALKALVSRKKCKSESPSLEEC